MCISVSWLCWSNSNNGYASFHHSEDEKKLLNLLIISCLESRLQLQLLLQQDSRKYQQESHQVDHAVISSWQVSCFDLYCNVINCSSTRLTGGEPKSEVVATLDISRKVKVLEEVKPLKVEKCSALELRQSK